MDVIEAIASKRKEVVYVNNNYKVENGIAYKLVFSKFIRKNGRKVYHPKGGVYKFWVKAIKAA